MKNPICFLMLLLISFNINAQYGYSTASLSMNRSNGITSQDQIIIEEYINYHRHQINLPKRNNEIALSLDYLNTDKKNVVLQVGIATKELLDYSKMPPINISLVIDKSGSMQSDNRLEKVKSALKHFIKGLRAHDFISIITYDSNATVILKATKVKDIDNLALTLKNLQPGGSTNLNEGLMLAYKEVTKNYDAKLTNKVILLTDGVANIGVINTEDIVKNSTFYNKKGIDISTIGVGKKINYSLLQQLSNAGKGANHFIGNSKEDISKVFINELESLLSSIAKQVSLTITYPKGMQINNVYGYHPEYAKNEITIPLKNLNNGLTQVILFDFKLNSTIKKSPIKVRLNYYSHSAQTIQKIEKVIKLKNKHTIDNEVLKNYSIGKMANSLKNMAKKIDENDYENAFKIVDESITAIDNKFPYLKDKDIIRVKEILIKNKTNLIAVNSKKITTNNNK